MNDCASYMPIRPGSVSFYVFGKYVGADPLVETEGRNFCILTFRALLTSRDYPILFYNIDDPLDFQSGFTIQSDYLIAGYVNIGPSGVTTLVGRQSYVVSPVLWKKIRDMREPNAIIEVFKTVSKGILVNGA